MISQDFIGKKYSPISFKVTKNKLVSFASATGQNSPIYFDIKAAKDHGYKTMIAPPTFLTVISMEQDQPYKYLEELNIPLDCFMLHKNTTTICLSILEIQLP